jgi:hypothetical protein
MARISSHNGPNTGPGKEEHGGYGFKWPQIRTATVAKGMGALSGDTAFPGGMMGIGANMDEGVAGKRAKKSGVPKKPKKPFGNAKLN